MINTSSEAVKKNKSARGKQCMSKDCGVPKVRLSMILRGETARILIELRARGIIRSYSDGVCQGIRLFYNKILEQDLRSARLKVLRDSGQEGELIDSE